MSTRRIDEAPVLDEAALQVLADHSCCGPAVEAEGATEVRSALQEGAAAPGAGAPPAWGEQGQQGAPAALTGAAGPPAARPSAKGGHRFSFRARLAGFLALAILILGAALLLVRPMDTGAQGADYTVEMSMSGFTPPSLTFPAGKAVTLKLVNKESPFHASGAQHQFAVDALGIDEKVEARQTRVITIPAQQAGEYTFYCDVCCGGQKSPTMRGKLTFQ